MKLKSVKPNEVKAGKQYIFRQEIGGLWFSGQATNKLHKFNVGDIDLDKAYIIYTADPEVYYRPSRFWDIHEIVEE